MDDKVTGYITLIVSVVGIGVYFWLVFLAPQQWAWLTIRMSAMAVVSVGFLVVAWIGYTLITSPSPAIDMTIDDFDTDESLYDDLFSDEKTDKETG
jgi:hypothetical protein